jgi:hypothetical protein
MPWDANPWKTLRKALLGSMRPFTRRPICFNLFSFAVIHQAIAVYGIDPHKTAKERNITDNSAAF